jgi:hypothetical protein
VDTTHWFVLTPFLHAAKQLAHIIENENWGGELQIHDQMEETDRALGTGRQEYGFLSIWWD